MFTIMYEYILVCGLIFLCDFDQARTYFLQCNPIKNCSSFMSKEFPNRKKMHNGFKKCLLEDYIQVDYKLIPPQQINETFAIRYQYIFKELVSVNRNIAEIDILMNLFWKDDCLRWNNSEISNFSYKLILLNTNEIWRPTIFDSSTITPIFFNDTQIIVHSNGECEESLHFRVKIICEDFPFYFPNDYQICQLNFGFKLITNFTLYSLNNLKKSCVTKHLEYEEWYIDCKEYVNFENVINTQEHWPFLNGFNYIYLGNITGKFTLKRLHLYSYSTVVLPSIMVCVCSQLITLTRPFDKHASILSSLFLSLVFILHNLPLFNKFSLLSLLINWIYCLCSSNLIIIITCNTIATRNNACLPILQRYYANICKFNSKPISLLVILSLSIRLPIIGILLLKTFFGFIIGIILMIIIWVVIIIFKILEGIEQKFKSNARRNTMINLEDNENKFQLIKLTTSIDLLTLAIQQLSARQQHANSSEESLLRVGTLNENNKSCNSSINPNYCNIEVKQKFKQIAMNYNYESQSFDGEQNDIKMLENNKITQKPISIPEWNGKLALCICRILNCIQILGNIFVSITLWVVYYRF